MKEKNTKKETETYFKYHAVFVIPEFPFFHKLNLNPFVGIEERLVHFPKQYHSSGLSFNTRLRDLAAVLMLNNKDTDKIITMSRAVRGYMDESCASLMKKHIKNFSDHKILVEENSYDLSSEISQVFNIADKNNWHKVAILVDSVQAIRAREIIDNLDSEINVAVVTMDEILTDNSYTKHHSETFINIISKFHKSNYWKYWANRERLVRILPSNVLTKITNISR